jgi:hypothetical protein
MNLLRTVTTISNIILSPVNLYQSSRLFKLRILDDLFPDVPIPALPDDGIGGKTPLPRRPLSPMSPVKYSVKIT